VEESKKLQSISQTRDLTHTKSQNKSLMNYSKEINDSKLVSKPGKQLKLISIYFIYWFSCFNYCSFLFKICC